MNSNIIGDAKYQELNMSFQFDELQEGKLIVNALVGHSPYQLQILLDKQMDSQYLKNALLNKNFKLVSKSPQILKLKVAFIILEFKNIEKITLNNLKQTVCGLTNNLKQQSIKNDILQKTVNKMNVQFDLITTKIADLTRLNQEIIAQNMKIKKEQSELMKNYNENKEENIKIKNQLQKMNLNYAGTDNDDNITKITQSTQRHQQANHQNQKQNYRNHFQAHQKKLNKTHAQQKRQEKGRVSHKQKQNKTQQSASFNLNKQLAIYEAQSEKYVSQQRFERHASDTHTYTRKLNGQQKSQVQLSPQTAKQSTQSQRQVNPQQTIPLAKAAQSESLASKNGPKKNIQQEIKPRDQPVQASKESCKCEIY